jgi:hypothetical protein
VAIALSVLGVDDVKIEPADTMDPRDTVRGQNPLGKIPVLIAEDGTALLRFAGDPRISRSTAPAAARSSRAIGPQRSRRCACRRCATASSMPRS